MATLNAVGRITVEVDVTPRWWNGEEHRIAVGVAAALSEAVRWGALREVRASRDGLRLVLEVPVEDSPVAAILERVRLHIATKLDEFRWVGRQVTASAQVAALRRQAS
jgi:hypothetical protein